MSTTPQPKGFTPPSYVSAFMITALILLLLGVVMIVQAIYDHAVPYGAIGCLVAAAVNFLYGQIATDIARSAWQTARLASDLQPVIAEIGRQAAEKSQRARNASKPPESEKSTEETIAPGISDAFFIKIGGRDRGPFSVVQLRELYSKGSISLDLATRTESGELGPTISKLLFPDG